MRIPRHPVPDTWARPPDSWHAVDPGGQPAGCGACWLRRLRLGPAVAQRTGHAVPGGVAVLVYHDDFPAGVGGAGRGGGEVAGEGGIERAEQPTVPRAFRAGLHGCERDGHLGQRPGRRLRVFRFARLAWAAVTAAWLVRV